MDIEPKTSAGAIELSAEALVLIDSGSAYLVIGMRSDSTGPGDKIYIA